MNDLDGLEWEQGEDGGWELAPAAGEAAQGTEAPAGAEVVAKSADGALDLVEWQQDGVGWRRWLPTLPPGAGPDVPVRQGYCW